MRRYRAPGRINLIGEHTDYQLGYVLPMAIDRDCVVKATPRSDDRFRVRSRQRPETLEIPLNGIESSSPAHQWTDHPLGVARELRRAGYTLDGVDLDVDSAVPVGAGLSSSASLEVACALALLGDQEIDRLDLAKLCLRAESDFVGLPCGIMDYAISICGEPGSALLIDCRSLEARVVRLPAGVSIIAVNTHVAHELAQTRYGERVEECAAACGLLGVDTLRDVELAQVAHLKRARHVVSENMRTLEFADAADTDGAERLETMGRLMFESHASLRDDYAVSCPELDFLVDTARTLPGVFGARLTGGGFGGCTVNLVSTVMADQFAHAIRLRYREQFNIDPDVFVCQPSAGAGRLL